MLQIGDIGLCASPRLASLALRAICGLLFSAVGFLANFYAIIRARAVSERYRVAPSTSSLLCATICAGPQGDARAQPRRSRW